MYQLINSTHTTQPNEQYAYDLVGNRTTTTVNSDNRLLSDGTYTYDNNGNLITRTTISTGEVSTYTWDSENRLIMAQVNGSVSQYKYDPFGRRIQKNVNNTITNYVYDGQAIIAEYDQNNQLITRYVQGPGIDEHLGMQRNGQAKYYHTDGLGSVTALTDDTGTIVQSYSYDSFGNISSIQNPNFIQPFAYTGREYDPETGLSYYRARYYDTITGRFISNDPIGFAGGDTNLYRYVANNPVNNTDPTGLAIFLCTRKTALGVGNHTYLWDDSVGAGRSCGWGSNSHDELGPARDSCVRIAGSEGRENEIMSCCERKNAKTKIWFPPVKDCHTLAGDCITGRGLKNPGAPGGRVGKPCDTCPGDTVN